MFELPCVDARLLEVLLDHLVPGEDEPVEEADEAVEAAVGEHGLPDPLVDAAGPLQQDPVEAEAGGLDVVEVGHRHPLHLPPGRAGSLLGRGPWDQTMWFRT